MNDTEFNDLDKTHKKIELLRARLQARLTIEDLNEHNHVDNKKNLGKKKIRQIKVPIIPPEYIDKKIESNKKTSKKNKKIEKPHLIKTRKIKEKLMKQEEMKQIKMNKEVHVKSTTNRRIIIISFLLVFLSTLGGIFSTGFLNIKHENTLVKLAEINYGYNKFITTHTGSNFLKIYSALYKIWSPTFIQINSSNVAIRYLMRILLSPLTYIFKISEIIFDIFSINGEIAATTSILVAASLCGTFYFTPLFAISSRVRKLFKNKLTYILLITSIGLIILSQNIHFIFMNAMGIFSCSIIIMLLFGSYMGDIILKIYSRLFTK